MASTGSRCSSSATWPRRSAAGWCSIRFVPASTRSNSRSSAIRISSRKCWFRAVCALPRPFEPARRRCPIPRATAMSPQGESAGRVATPGPGLSHGGGRGSPLGDRPQGGQGSPKRCPVGPGHAHGRLPPGRSGRGAGAALPPTRQRRLPSRPGRDRPRSGSPDPGGASTAQHDPGQGDAPGRDADGGRRDRRRLNRPPPARTRGRQQPKRRRRPAVAPASATRDATASDAQEGEVVVGYF